MVHFLEVGSFSNVYRHLCTESFPRDRSFDLVGQPLVEIDLEAFGELVAD